MATLSILSEKEFKKGFDCGGNLVLKFLHCSSSPSRLVSNATALLGSDA